MFIEASSELNIALLAECPISRVSLVYKHALLTECLFRSRQANQLSDIRRDIDLSVNP